MTTKAIEARAPRHLLDRLLDAPNPTLAVQSLEPRVLHQLIRGYGLEDCGEIVALATAEQLMQVFDEDLWRSERAGKEDQFDPDRFGLWLEVLVDAGVEIAAQKLSEMDFDFVTAAICQHIFVLGGGSTVSGRDVDDWGADGEVGGYRIIARRSESWDALTAVLVCLGDEHPEFFQRLMSRCFFISTDYVEDNGIVYNVAAADEQIMSDVAFGRERRREEQGYVTPAQAVAFLEASRHLRPGQDRVREWHHSTQSYFRERRNQEPIPSGEVGMPPSSDRLLPGETGESRLARLTSQLGFVREHDEAVYAQRVEELGYLANVLLGGCSFESRRLNPIEASEAVAAVCNLGLENWRSQRGSALPQALLMGQDLVTVFRIGWSVIYEKVCLYTARRLVRILSDLSCDDPELQEQISDLTGLLKRQIRAGTPWRARDSFDVIAILDTPTWSTLLGLVNECPVVPRPVSKSDPTAALRVGSEVEFISENRQVSWVRDFADSLPSRLSE